MQGKNILRGDIWLFAFGQTGDLTIEKTRPVIVIQNNFANLKSSTTIVSAIRTNPKVGQLPVGVKLSPGTTGLKEVSYADLGHIYTVDSTKLLKKVGSVPASDLEKISEAICISLGIKEYR